jgi:hypothetical protein
VYAISSRGKESGVQNQKAKRIEKIRVMFHLQMNPLASKEIKTVYLRIIEPTGNTLSDYSLGSGSLMFKGKELSTRRSSEFSMKIIISRWSLFMRAPMLTAMGSMRLSCMRKVF